MDSSKWTRDGYNIRDTEHYSSSINNLCMSELYSDVTLISQEGTSYPAHRSILAARSNYFSALLYGGLKESTEKEVKLLCSDAVLKPVLMFLYSGEVLIESSQMSFLLILLDEARRMCIFNLQAALEDLVIIQLQSENDIKNGIDILNFAVEKDFKDISKIARTFLEKNVDDILISSVNLQNFSVLSLKAFLSGNDLDVPEIEIFRGVAEWIKSAEITSQEKNSILSEVRLDQMTIKQIAKEIRPSGLFSDSELCEAMCLQDNIAKSKNSRKVIINENLCLSSRGARVKKADFGNSSRNAIIDGKRNTNDYDLGGGYAMTNIGERMEVRLPAKQKINKIKILFHDREAKIVLGQFMDQVKKDYSYKIESSLDGLNWELVADFSKYKGRSWQTVYFQERRMMYIGIVGTNSFRENKYLGKYGSSVPLCLDTTLPSKIHVLAIEAMLDTDTEEKDRNNSGMKPV